jgi:8-oxo-dGDP phosphatase
VSPAGPADHTFPVHQRVEHFTGPLFSVVTDRVTMPDGDVVARDFLRHVGAVAVVPYDEPADEVVLVRQYRHPVGARLWELPAGLTDVDGETLPEVAVRELAEEADLACDRLDLLLDLHPSPGCSDEWIRVFLARGLRPARQAYQRRHEEATMVTRRVPLSQAVRMVFDGQVTNATAAAGVLALARARDLGWVPLRPVDALAPPSSDLPTGDRP